MSEYWFSMIRIFPYEERIVDYVLLRENTGLRKPVFVHVLQSAS